MHKFKPNYLTYSILATLTMSTAYAENSTTQDQLNEIVVSGNTSEPNVQEKKVGETQITSHKLSKRQAADSRDLVRYETGITVVETGRTGSSGYAVRGVDENRVGIMVDGLRQAETLSSQGFKELFEGYGNFNNTRNDVEIENVKMATITKGADSMKSGSGALGGSVAFETKDARDFLLNKNYHIGIKRGYQTMNNQNLTSVTLAGKYKWFDVLFINTERKGHEIENYYYDIYPNEEADHAAVGRTREKADPYRITRNSNLIKIGFQPNDEHRFSVALDDSKLKSKGADLSYSLRAHSRTDTERYGERLTNDKSQRKNTQFTYENFTQTPLWDHFKVSYSSQKITNNARTDEYCYTSKCIQVENKQGLHLEESNGVYRVVDKTGGEITGKGIESGWSTESEYRNAKGEKLSGFDYKEQSVESTLIDCEKLDCSKKYRVFVKNNEKYESKYHFEDRQIETKTLPNGKKYGYIPLKSIPNAWGGLQEEELSYLFPRSAGYSRNDYNDRDLNTDTNQINLDFDKEFELGKTNHSLKYGGLYSKTEKSMVNKDGYQGGNVQWWADNFFCNEPIEGTYPVERKPAPDKWPSGSCTGNYRAKTGNLSSYLIPVTTKNHAFYFGDNIKFTDWVGLDLNYRYDQIKHLPSYNPNIPVPKGLIAGIFVPFPDGAVPYGPGANCGYNTDCMNKNFAQNLEQLLRTTSYKHHSYNIGLNLDPLDWMRVQFKYSNGFRAPTSDEVYMTFKHPSFSITPNTKLKAEIAKTKEVAFTFYKDHSYFTLSAFRTDYDHFIDLVFMGERAIEQGSALTYPFYQNQNRDGAKVTGVEVNSHIELGDLIPLLQGFRMGYKLTHQKGKVNGNIPMNAIQPTTSVYNLGYSTEGDKYGIDLFITDVAPKKRSDTYNMYWKTQSEDPNRLVQGKRVTDSTLAWRSGHYTILDAIVYARPIKNLTLTAGVYNITDRKYITWDSARSIRAIGTLNLIDQNTGAGIKRFYAPGRNFRFNAELTF